MTEILTESFCERCGTRYTFESAAPRKSRLGRVRTLSKGVRNFVMSDDSSFSEAMAEARSEEELTVTSHQLDAFHQTFNFCLTCRQYTCGDCWNGAEGRCLTCAPLPGQEEPVSLAQLVALEPEVAEPIEAGNGHAAEDDTLEAWPEMDLPPDRLARVLDLSPEPAELAAAATIAGQGAPGEVEVPAEEPAPAADELEPRVIGVAPGQSLDEAIAAYEAAAEGLAAESVEPVGGMVAPAAGELEPQVVGVAPGQSLDEAIAAYEAMIAAEEVHAAGQDLETPVVAPVDEQLPAEGEVEEPAAGSALAAIAALEAMGSAGEQQPLAEPATKVAADVPEAEVEVEAEAMDSPTPEPEPVGAAPSPEDHIEQPTWPVPPAPVAPVVPPPAPAPGPTPSPWLTVAPDDGTTPQWPTAPQWPVAGAQRDVPGSLAGRAYLPQADASALWAASNREVLGAAPVPLAAAAPPQAQPCVSCGLSLSANARFCRRCGTRQG